jgi:hypothetical protein
MFLESFACVVACGEECSEVAFAELASDIEVN